MAADAAMSNVETLKARLEVRLGPTAGSTTMKALPVQPTVSCPAPRPGLLAASLAMAVALLASGAQAQDAKKGAPQNPVGAWGAPSVQAAPQPGRAFDARQVELIGQISRYFNDLTTMRGRFLQTGADKKVAKGKFYVKRPGRLRFEYGAPSKQLIVSDGSRLAIQDLDLKTDDSVGLDQTSFRLLLKKDVDLMRDAQILDLQEADDLVILTIMDKNPEAAGRIRLFLTRRPQLELREWVTTDAQATDTRVEVTELVKGEDLDAALFKIEPIGLQKGAGNQ